MRHRRQTAGSCRLADQRVTFMPSRLPSALIVSALGLTQIIGYGTLYYSFSVLAGAIGTTFGWSQAWIYAALSVALLCGGLVSPFAGQLFDRFGAARVMTVGSVLSGMMLISAGLSPSGLVFAVALTAMEVASTLVLYAAAFAALVQLEATGAQRSITHLTLIAGFASTLFWPLTAGLLHWLDWRGVYFVFGAFNILLCAPIHGWMARFPRQPAAVNLAPQEAAARGFKPSPLFVGLMIGFAIEGFLLAAILMHIAPMLTSLGLGGTGILITTLFGPAQVLSRFTNMIFGKGLRQTQLAIFAAALPAAGLLILALGAPNVVAGIAFAVVFGLGSGLTSIVSGSLPLELFGSDRYGERLGWLSSARQVASAIGPFLLALLMDAFGVPIALSVVILLGAGSTLLFIRIAITHRAKFSAAPQAASDLPETQTP